MHGKTIKLLILFIFCLIFLPARPALAVLPPDFIFNIGAQLTQFVAFALFLAITTWGAVWHFFKNKIQSLKHPKISLTIGIFTTIAIISIAINIFTACLQEKKITNWLEESIIYESKNNISPSDKPYEVPKNYHGLIEEARADKTVALQNSFFLEHQNSPISISPAELNKIINDKKNNYTILDSREDIEFENGHFPGSTHIRFADLQTGRWQELKPDKSIYIICALGIRGEAVANYLRQKNLLAFYIEGGLNAWVKNGGEWIGNLNFNQRYTDNKFKIAIETDEIKRLEEYGVFLVDTREKNKFKQKNIPGSINLPLSYTPSEDLNQLFDQVPPQSEVVTVCDAFYNCFDAKMLGAELEKRGHTFLGRYNKPWEYE